MYILYCVNIVTGKVTVRRTKWSTERVTVDKTTKERNKHKNDKKA